MLRFLKCFILQAKVLIQILFLFLFLQASVAHEQWLLTNGQIEQLKQSLRPPVFSQLGPFNITVTTIAFLMIIFWIFFNKNIVAPQRLLFPNDRVTVSIFILRLATGAMLIMCSLGLLPKIDIPYFTLPTLFAPDLLINSLPNNLSWLKWVEFALGALLIGGILIREMAFVLICVSVLAIYLFGKPMLQYIGFYLGIALFFMTQGGGDFSLSLLDAQPGKKSTIPIESSLIILQFFTGANFIYSAITIKFFQPNLDILILKLHQSYSFGLSYDYFVFLMLVVEIFFGLLIILGWGLRLLSFILLCLFIFMSWNVSENLLAHTFIYGILFTFIILGGVPLFDKHLSNRNRFS